MKALIPDFAVGCRRMTPGVGYLSALTQSNVQTVTTGIEEICPEGIKLANGELIEVDAIVCATGFNLSFIPRFPIIGTSGNLQDIWRDSVPAAYMSCMVPGMPNYFSTSYPYTVFNLSTSRTNAATSLPWSKRTHRSWQRRHHHRASRQIHHEAHYEMPTRRHRLRPPLSRCSR